MRPHVEQTRALSDERLREEEQSVQLELLNLRFKSATRQLGNPNELRFARKRLAQVKTVMRERELARAQQGQQ